MRGLITCVLLLFSGSVLAQQAEGGDPPKTQDQEHKPSQEAEEQAAKEKNPPAKDGVKTLSGISILGNDEAPKSLVIVPWKSSEIGTGITVSDVFDDHPRPVDKDVFMRELRYYEIRSSNTSVNDK